MQRVCKIVSGVPFCVCVRVIITDFKSMFGRIGKLLTVVMISLALIGPVAADGERLDSRTVLRARPSNFMFGNGGTENVLMSTWFTPLGAHTPGTVNLLASFVRSPIRHGPPRTQEFGYDSNGSLFLSIEDFGVCSTGRNDWDEGRGQANMLSVYTRMLSDPESGTGQMNLSVKIYRNGAMVKECVNKDTIDMSYLGYSASDFSIGPVPSIGYMWEFLVFDTPTRFTVTDASVAQLYRSNSEAGTWELWSLAGGITDHPDGDQGVWFIFSSPEQAGTKIVATNALHASNKHAFQGVDVALVFSN